MKSAGFGVGATLSQKRLDIGQLAQQWDRSLGGEISKKEFRRELLLIGVDTTVVSEMELDNLFDSLDVSGDGSLEISEVKQGLKKLQESVRPTRQLSLDLPKQVEEASKKMKLEQKAWQN